MERYRLQKNDLIFVGSSTYTFIEIDKNEVVRLASTGYLSVMIDYEKLPCFLSKAKIFRPVGENGTFLLKEITFGLVYDYGELV